MTEPRFAIASHAADSDYAPTSRVLLWKLGYALLPPEEAGSPALRVVRDDRLDEVPAPTAEPIILLTRARKAKPADPRVVGSVRRPAGLHELYRLFQAATEAHPRAVPRVPCSLAARATVPDDGQRFELRITSLSENGCLVSGERLPALDARLALEIEMPWGERLGGPAVAAYEQGDQLGLVFHDIRLAERKKLVKAVRQLLERL
ncbi:MAG: PilZ domain-containing protein [Deltaproteobacteria bacterium]|nr:PilZ domain-containing protein [Deltaproteobacteria bacterium]